MGWREYDFYTKERYVKFCLKARVDDSIRNGLFKNDPEYKDSILKLHQEQLSHEMVGYRNPSLELSDFADSPVDYSKHNQPFPEDNLF